MISVQSWKQNIRHFNTFAAQDEGKQNDNIGNE